MTASSSLPGPLFPGVPAWETTLGALPGLTLLPPLCLLLLQADLGLSSSSAAMRTILALALVAVGGFRALRWQICRSLINEDEPLLTGQETLFQGFIKEHLIDEHWIGLRRESQNQPWMRPDGSLFNNSFPIRGGGECAYVNGPVVSSTWCTNTRRWICSKPAS